MVDKDIFDMNDNKIGYWRKLEDGKDVTDQTGDGKSFVEDYGQRYNTRQVFKRDFNKEVTKFMGGII